MPVVTFLPSYRKIEVAKGSSVLEASQRANLSINAVCGGQGKCGKCIVYLRSGEASFDREKYGIFFSGDDLDRGASLACETFIAGDVTVEVPETSLIQEQKILMENRGTVVAFSPSVKKYYIEMSPPTLDDPSPDLTRLLWAIEKQGGPKVEKNFAPLDILQDLPRLLRLSGWKVTATVAIVPGGYRLINVEEDDARTRLYGAAVDLGTTTVVAEVRSLIDGAPVATASNYRSMVFCR